MGPSKFGLSAVEKGLESLTLAYVCAEPEYVYSCDVMLDCVLTNLHALDVSKCADITCIISRLSIGACLPKLTKLKARATCGPEDEDIALRVLASRVQDLLLFLVNPGPVLGGVNLDHCVFLKADPRLVVLNTKTLGIHARNGGDDQLPADIQ